MDDLAYCRCCSVCGETVANHPTLAIGNVVVIPALPDEADVARALHVDYMDETNEDGHPVYASVHLKCIENWFEGELIEWNRSRQNG